MKLYHGSLTKITDKYLQPNQAFALKDYLPRISFSKRYEVALLYALTPIRAFLKKKNLKVFSPQFSCHIDFSTNPITIYELYENMFLDLFQEKCYIYICDSPETLVEVTENQEYIVSTPQEIVDIIEIDNFFEELKNLEKKGLIQIQYFNDWDYHKHKNYIEDYVAYRIAYCNTKEELEFFIENFKGYSAIDIEIKKKNGK